MENIEYCESKLRETIEPLFYSIVTANPKDIVNFSIDWLIKKGGYTANGLTIDERHELLNLRKEIKKLRELEADDKKLNNKSEMIPNDSDEEEEEEENDKDENWEAETQRKSLIRGPRIAVSAEAYGDYNQKGDYKPVVFAKTEDQITSIKVRITQSFLFNSLDSKELKIIIDAMEQKVFSKGEVIINQGDFGDCLYIVDQGDLECYKVFNSGEEKLVKRYTEGEAFGELALLYNCPRAAKVVAFNQVNLWKLDRETFNVIVKEAAVKKRQKYEEFLKRVEILSTIDPYEITQISDALKTASFKQGEYVLREGDMGDIFYMIEEGEAEATITSETGKPAVTVKCYRAGDYFGELALIKGDPRAANILAKTNLKLVSLDRGSFKRLLGPLEEILKRNAEKYIKFIK